MMRSLLLLAVSILLTFSLYAESNEPCKDIAVPEEISSSTVIFELATYDEYVYEIALESTIMGITIDENSILNERTFKKIRQEKIKQIKDHYKSSFAVMTKRELEDSNLSEGFVFKENVLSDLVSEDNNKFTEYTSFEILDTRTNKSYTLANPSDTKYSSCLINKENYKFRDILELF